MVVAFFAAMPRPAATKKKEEVQSFEERILTAMLPTLQLLIKEATRSAMGCAPTDGTTATPLVATDRFQVAPAAPVMDSKGKAQTGSQQKKVAKGGPEQPTQVQEDGWKTIVKKGRNKKTETKDETDIMTGNEECRRGCGTTQQTDRSRKKRQGRHTKTHRCRREALREINT